jgi:hypothetical protein
MNNPRKSTSGESGRLCCSKVVSMLKSIYFNNLYLLATNSLLLLFCIKLFVVVGQIITVTCGGGTRSSRPSSATNSLLLLVRSLQLPVAEGQGLQDPVLQQTLCCCCLDHYSYLWRRDKVFKTQFWCLVFQRRLYLYKGPYEEKKRKAHMLENLN